MDKELSKNLDNSSSEELLGKYFKDIQKEEILSLEEEKELIEKYFSGDEKAKERILKTHLRLVINLAKKFRGYGLPLLDLISEGNIGLMKALTKFDPNRGVRFATYAAWWVKQYIKRYIIDNLKIIRIPVHMVDLLKTFTKTLKSSKNDVIMRNSAADEIGVDIAKIEELMIISQDTLSYNNTLSDNSNYSFEDVLLSENDKTPCDICQKKELVEKVLNLMTLLDEKEREVIVLRFGLIDSYPMTLEEVGVILKLTKERIRQIEVKAINKLKFYIKKHKVDYFGG